MKNQIEIRDPCIPSALLDSIAAPRAYQNRILSPAKITITTVAQNHSLL